MNRQIKFVDDIYVHQSMLGELVQGLGQEDSKIFIIIYKGFHAHLHKFPCILILNIKLRHITIFRYHIP